MRGSSRGTAISQLLPLVAGIVTGGVPPRHGVSPDEVSRKLRLDYLYSAKDQGQKTLDGVQVLMEQFYRHDFGLDTFFNDALNLMRRRVWLREATVALLDRKDGCYKYRCQSGLRKEAWEAHLVLRYGTGDLVNPAVYRGREISRMTTLFLAEDNPYAKGEDGTFSRPIMLQSKRNTVDESIEGDYFDTWMFGKGKDIVGWMEFSGTTAGKLPDATSIKWIELVASLCSVAVLLSEARSANARQP